MPEKRRCLGYLWIVYQFSTDQIKKVQANHRQRQRWERFNLHQSQLDIAPFIPRSHWTQSFSQAGSSNSGSLGSRGSCASPNWIASSM